MYGQIIPKIYSADKRLLFSETVCFFPKNGIILKLPASDSSEQNEVIFHFCFVDELDKKNSSFAMENIDNKTLKIKLVNFGSTLGSGTTSPIELSIGNKPYSILLYAHRLEDQVSLDNQLLHMTISMYGAIK